MKLTLCLVVAALVSGAREPAQQTSSTIAAGAVEDTLLVLNKTDSTLSLFSIATGEAWHEAPTGLAPHEITVSPDGRLAVIANYGDRTVEGDTLTVFDLVTLETARTIELGEHRRPHGLEFLDDRRVVVTTEVSRSIVTVDVETGELLGAVATGATASHMVTLDRVAQRAFVANISSGSVTVIDLEEGRVIKQIRTGDGAEGITITPDGKEVWVTNRKANTVSVIDVETLEVVATIECGKFPIRVEITPDGRRALVSAAISGAVAILDVAERAEVTRVKMELQAKEGLGDRVFHGFKDYGPVPVGIQIDPSGSRAYVANTNADLVTIIDLSTLEVVGRFETGLEPDGMAWARIARKPESDS